jgi:uncharacterized membrane protein
MAPPQPAWTDKRVEQILGNLLRAGVTIAAAVVTLGGVIYLLRHGLALPQYHVFQGEPTDLRGPRGILNEALSFHGRGIIQLGLLLLIATPVARVIFSVVAFALERDYVYVAITLVVFAVLVVSLAGGHL